MRGPAPRRGEMRAIVAVAFSPGSRTSAGLSPRRSWCLRGQVLYTDRRMSSSSDNVTKLLAELRDGDREALDRCFAVVYRELRAIAARQLRNERAGHTLQPTALVHEVYMRLVDQRQVDCQHRAHFFGVAAQVMRRILVDHARRHGASKRGEGVRCVSIDLAKDVAAPNEAPILALDQALDRLEKIGGELSKIVELRAFGGLTIEEAAHVLGVSPSTAKREWRTAKAWLNRELGA